MIANRTTPDTMPAMRGTVLEEEELLDSGAVCISIGYNAEFTSVGIVRRIARGRRSRA